MAAAKSTRSKRTAIDEELAELRDSLQDLTQLREMRDELADLHETIMGLISQVACLTLAVDELADQVHGQSKLLQDGGYPSAPPLTSMPLDPTAADWQINRKSAADLPENHPGLASTAAMQQHLFETAQVDSSDS